jgi:SAM-dependent methyltransferase
MTTSTPPLERIDCIFCGAGATSSVVIRENGFDGRQCQSCRLIFVSPRPGADQIADLYGHDEAQVPAQSHLASGFSKRLYARHSLRILRKYTSPGAILEIGAGAGFFLDEARKQGFDPFAIEFNGIQANHIRTVLGIPCEATPLSNGPFERRAFDVVYHCDVLSHFHDPIGEFRASHQALREGGLLMFETGNLGDVSQQHLESISRFQYPDHLFFFSRRNISQLLDATGFQLLTIHGYSTLPDLLTTRIRARLRTWSRGFTLKSLPAAAAEGTGSAPAKLAAPSPSTGLGARIGRAAKSGDQFVNYLIRYGLGRIAPKRARPQTLIVVARKCQASR